MNRNKYVLGITGEAGSGKSAVMDILEKEFGAYLIYADPVAAELQKPGNVSYSLIKEHFGDGILSEDGTIDRKKLADIVYKDKEELQMLNSFTHPYVRESIVSDIERVRKEEPERLIVIEAALLLECGYRDICSEIWYIGADEDVRRKRLKETRGYTDERIDGIIKNQLKSLEFRALCDVTVENNGTIDELREALSTEIRDFLERGRR